MRRVLAVGVTVTACLAVAGVSWCSSLVPVNLPEMVRQADRIFVVTAVSERTGRDERGIPATVTTFKVSQVLKGAHAARIEVKQFGVTEVQPDGLAAWIDGMPRYQAGSEYLLFLKPDSVFGFTMPVGAFQGTFDVKPAGQGKKAIVNSLGNANLLRGLEAEDLARLGLTPESFPFVSRGRGPMHLDEMTRMVERLSRGQGVAR